MHQASPLLLAVALALTACTAAPGAAPTPPTEGAAPAAYGLQAIRAVGKHKGDYLPAHNFKLEIDGIISGGFRRVKGLDDLIPGRFKDGDDPIVHKRAGKAKYKNIVLKRGMVNDASLLEWHRQVLAGKTDRKSGSVIFLDRAGAEVLRYTFSGYPTSLALADEQPKEGLAIAELELAVEKVQRVDTRR